MYFVDYIEYIFGMEYWEPCNEWYFVGVYDVFCARFMSMFSIYSKKCVNRNRLYGLFECVLLII